MTSTQKKWISLAVAIVVVTLASSLTRNNDQVDQTPSRQVVHEAPEKIPQQQGSGHVRKWGESGFTGFGTSRDPKRVGDAAASSEASNAEK